MDEWYPCPCRPVPCRLTSACVLLHLLLHGGLLYGVQPAHPPSHPVNVCVCVCVCAQAAQVRKSSYIGNKGLPYLPDAYHECTVFAGTIVRQVLEVLPLHEALFPLSLWLLRFCVVNFLAQQ